MASKRDKNKQKPIRQTGVQEPVTAKAKDRHPIAKKMGDFCIDVAKLIIGGVILAGLMKQDIDYLLLTAVGTGVVALFVLLGIYLISFSSKE